MGNTAELNSGQAELVASTACKEVISHYRAKARAKKKELDRNYVNV